MITDAADIRWQIEAMKRRLQHSEPFLNEERRRVLEVVLFSGGLTLRKVFQVWNLRSEAWILKDFRRKMYAAMQPTWDLVAQKKRLIMTWSKHSLLAKAETLRLTLDVATTENCHIKALADNTHAQIMDMDHRFQGCAEENKDLRSQLLNNELQRTAVAGSVRSWLKPRNIYEARSPLTPVITNITSNAGIPSATMTTKTATSEPATKHKDPTEASVTDNPVYTSTMPQMCFTGVNPLIPQHRELPTPPVNTVSTVFTNDLTDLQNELRAMLP